MLTIATGLVGAFDTRCPLELTHLAVGTGHFFPELYTMISSTLIMMINWGLPTTGPIFGADCARIPVRFAE